METVAGISDSLATVQASSSVQPQPQTTPDGNPIPNETDTKEKKEDYQKTLESLQKTLDDTKEELRAYKAINDRLKGDFDFYKTETQLNKELNAGHRALQNAAETVLLAMQSTPESQVARAVFLKQEFDSKMTEYEQKSHQLMQELLVKNDTNTRLIDNLQKLAEKDRRQIEQLAKYENDLKDATQKIEALEKYKQQHVEELTSAKKELEEIKPKVEGLTRLTEQQTQDLITNEKKIQEAGVRSAELTNQNAKLSKDLTGVRQELDETKTKIADLTQQNKQQTEKLSGELAAIKKEKNKIQIQLATSEKKVGELGEDLDSTKTQVIRLMEESTKQKEQNRSLMTSFDTLLVQNGQLSKELGSMKQECIEVKKTNEALMQQNKKLLADIQEKGKDATTLSTTLTEMTACNTQLSKDLTSVQEELNRAKKINETLKQQIEQQREQSSKQAEEARLTIERLRKDINTKDVELRENTNLLNMADESLRAIRDEHKALAQESIASQKNNAETLINHAIEFRKLVNMITELRAENQGWSSKLKELYASRETNTSIPTSILNKTSLPATPLQTQSPTVFQDAPLLTALLNKCKESNSLIDLTKPGASSITSTTPVPTASTPTMPNIPEKIGTPPSSSTPTPTASRGSSWNPISWMKK